MFDAELYQKKAASITFRIMQLFAEKLHHVCRGVLIWHTLYVHVGLCRTNVCNPGA